MNISLPHPAQSFYVENGRIDQPDIGILPDSEARQLLIDQLREILEGSCSGQIAAVDKEGRSPGDSKRVGLQFVGLDQLCRGRGQRRHIPRESVDIEIQFTSILHVTLGIQAVLVSKELVMEFPESTLLESGRSGARGRFGVFVHRER
jgi:hypothetical protein